MKDYIFRSSLHTVKVSLSRFMACLSTQPTRERLQWYDEMRMNKCLVYIHILICASLSLTFIIYLQYVFCRNCKRITKSKIEWNESGLNIEILMLQQQNKVHLNEYLRSSYRAIARVSYMDVACELWNVHFSRRIFIKRTLEILCFSECARDAAHSNQNKYTILANFSSKTDKKIRDSMEKNKKTTVPFNGALLCECLSLILFSLSIEWCVCLFRSLNGI